jgi:hypothetical protein
MKKYLIHPISIFLLTFILNAYSYGQYQTEGLAKYSSYEINTDNITKKKTVGHVEWTNIWFKDSAVIYELRINLESKESTIEGTIVKRSYPVWRYVYLDLRTMRCQDYFNFKDTAMPLFNYLLKSNDTVSLWRFFIPKTKYDTLPGMFTMKDTIMDNIVYKRVKVLYKYYPEQNYFGVYYFDCNTKKNIFHLNRTLSDMYPNCKSNRIDFFDSSGNVSIRNEYKIIKDTLSCEEECIFKQWQKNAKKTKLPLLSYSETKRIPIPYHEHENPTIKILPLEKKR